MGEELQCHTGLGLGIGEVFASGQRPNKSPVQLNLLFPSWMKEEDDQEGGQMITTKEEEEKHARAPRSLPRDHEEEGGTRKKLRLSKEQSTILEESFRVHNTLNLNQKHQLAQRLSLLPRQVEVWFQNRRARTKLKQTEVECEFLKKCCGNLSDENRRLKRELQELRSAAKTAAGSSVYVQLPKATTLRMCPSCESISLDDNTKSGSRGVRINDSPSPEKSRLLRLCN